MLRNKLFEQSSKSHQPPAGFAQKQEKRSLVGRSVYSRGGDLVGYSLNFDSDQAKTSAEGVGCDGFASNIGMYIALLNRVVRSCSRSALSSRVGGEVRGIGVESRIIMHIQPQILLIERFAGALVRATEEVKNQGFCLCVAFVASDLAFIRDVRAFRQALYHLGDHGVELIMRNPALSGSWAGGASVIERAVSMVSITPDWLGVGVSERSFDHSTYFEQVTRLSSVIHEENKVVVLEGVQNAWHESFVSSLPIAYFSRLQSEDDVYV